jgi:hypothetical protein
LIKRIDDVAEANPYGRLVKAPMPQETGESVLLIVADF